MIKRSLSWLLTAAMLITLFLPVTAGAQPPEFTCAIVETSVEYDTLASALTAVADAQTIRLLTNVTYGDTLSITGKSIAIDVNGYGLTVTPAAGSNGIAAEGGYDITISDSNTSANGSGALAVSCSGESGFSAIYSGGEGCVITVNVPTQITVTTTTGSAQGIYANSGDVTFNANATVTASGYGAIGLCGQYGGAVTMNGETTISASGDNSIGLCATDGGSVSVGDGTSTSGLYGVYSNGASSTIDYTGSVSTTDASSYGVYTFEGGTAAVTGDVDARYIGVIANNGDATVDGSVTAGFYGVYVINAGYAHITGDSTSTDSQSFAAYASGSDSVIDVDGNASGSRYGAIAVDGAVITVGGDCTAEGGLDPMYSAGAVAQGLGSSVTVMGDASVTGSSGYGAQANSGGATTVKGSVTATGTGSFGAIATGADYGSTVTVDGEIDAESYIKVGTLVKGVDDNTEPTTKEGYLTYTDGATPLHTVWVKAQAEETDAFAWVAYNNNSGIPEGAAKLTLPNGPLTTVSSFGTFWITCADFVGSTLYGLSSEGSSGLYTIDPEKGTYALVGYTGAVLQGFAYDTETGTAYATDGGNLYSIDLETGSLTLVGILGNNITFMVGIAADSSGNLYGIDIENDSLYSISTATGAATLIGSLQFNINYAQDIAYDRNNGILYGALWANTGGLYTIDTETGAATHIYDFNAEVDGFAIPYTDEGGGEHDALYVSGFENGDPGVWSSTASGWSIVGGAGMTSPAAAPHGGDYAAKFDSSSLSSGVTDLLRLMNDLSLSAGCDYTLSFWMYHDTGWTNFNDYINVQISTDGGATWTNISPAIYRNLNLDPGFTGWREESISLADYAGETIRIGFLGTSGWGNDIYLDDVSVTYTGEAEEACIIDGCETPVSEGGFTAYQDIGEERYYEVSTAAQLAHIGEHLDCNFIQTADIDLVDYNEGVWTPIGGFGDTSNYCTPGYFTGKYLGDGHKIKNLNIQLADSGRNAAYAGVFACLSGSDSSVSDLTVTVSGVSIDVYNYIHFGAVAGALEGGSITNCDAQFLGDVDHCDTPNGDVGGIAGYSYKAWNNETEQYEDSVIQDCTVGFSGGSILGDGWSLYAGGIMGRGESTLLGCSVVVGAGEQILAPTVGGLVGMFYAKTTGTAAEDCSVTGGGKIVLSPQQYYDCCAGGLVGRFAEGELLSCSNQVQVDATGVTILAQGSQVYAGGLVGYAGTRSTLRGCKNEAQVTLTISNNVVDNYGNPAAPQGEEYAFAGGLVGYLYGYSRKATIENCENDASIFCFNRIPGMRAYAGGLVGHADSGDGEYAGVNVYNCANLGANRYVHAEGGSVLAGGLFGSTTFHDFETPNITLSNCYNRSSVDAVSCSAPAATGVCVGITAGGIIGASGEVTVSNTYSTAGSISAESSDEYGADTYEGGLFGILYMTTASLNYCQSNENVTKAAGGVVSGMDIVASDDVAGCYECATAAELTTKSFFSGWHWNDGGGEAPDYYTAMDPWRQTEANGYPVLKGKPYSAPTGGGGGGITYYTITATASAGGTITPSGSVSVQEGSAKTFTIKAGDGYVISDVLVDGASVGKAAEYKFTSVSKNHTIEAKFAAPECPSRKFTDVDTSLWYHDCIDFVLSHGLFHGLSDSTFAPEAPMTRGMFAAVLHRLENKPAPGGNNPFGDVESGKWYTDAILWCFAKGVVKGNGAGAFSPNGNITREQIAVILCNYAVYKGYDVSAEAGTDLSSYADCSGISGYALTAMRWAVGAGLIQGKTGNTLDPLGDATRAEVAQILMRFIETYVEQNAGTELS